MTQSDLGQLQVLVIGTPVGGEDIGLQLGPHAHLERVETVEQALRAIRSRVFDLVVCRTAEFTSMAGGQWPGDVASVLDSVNQAVCIVGQAGQVDWANPKMLGFAPDVRDRVRRCCVETFANAPSHGTQIRGRRFSLTTKNNEQYEVTTTPVMDARNEVTEVVAVAWDVTSARRLQDKIDAIDRAGRELLNLDAEQFARLDMQERMSLLEQKILRSTQELLHFESFEIRIIDKKNNKLELVLASDMSSKGLTTDIYASCEGNGIRGYVASRGRSYICPDVTQDPRALDGTDMARSSLTVPLFLHDKIVGVAVFESNKLAAFNEDDRQFAEIFGRYLAVALNILELLVTERHATTGQLGSNVMAEITGPLNDILTDVESLVEDYIGHDDLRARLRVMSENAVKIRESIKTITSRKPALIGARSAPATAKDAVLSGKRVLIADDEDVIRDTVRDVLTGYGCRVFTAVDGAGAIELIDDEPFDLVLSDIKMPHKSGYEVFAAAKEANEATPVILTTGFGYDPNHSIVRARRQGLAAVLFKPFKVDELLHEIRSALKGAAK